MQSSDICYDIVHINRPSTFERFCFGTVQQSIYTGWRKKKLPSLMKHSSKTKTADTMKQML